VYKLISGKKKKV